MDRLDNRISKKLLSGMDTNYVSLPKNPFTISALYRGSYLRCGIMDPSCPVVDVLKGLLHATTSEAKMSTSFRSSVGLGFSFRNLNVQYFQNVSRGNGRVFNVSSYGNKFGGEILYQSTSTVNASFDVNSRHGLDPIHIPNLNTFGDISMSRLCINAYYVISNKKFSYLSAMRNSMIQKRSAGSFITSLTYYRTNCDFSKNTALNFIYFRMNMRTITNQLALGCGYAYNIVLPKQAMIHIAAQPMLTLNLKNYSAGNTDRSSLIPEIIRELLHLNNSLKNYHGLGFACQCRLALYIPFSERIFTSINGEVFYFDSGHNKGFRTYTTDFILYTSLGVRF
ncbi:MAG: DUF4421 family protein [Alistipes sp.]|nr:DUF4421 family protein [Candidatus Alistipes equi]